MLRWIFWNPVKFIVQNLSQKLVFTIGNIGGVFYYYIHKERISKIRFELLKSSLKMSEKETQDAIKRSCIGIVLSELEVMKYPKITSSNIDFYTELVRKEHIDTALKKGKGVILLHAHFGNAQMLMPALGYRGYEINQVGLLPTDIVHDFGELFERDKNNTAIKELEERKMYERSLPANFIYLKTSMRPAFEVLKRNGIVAIAIDGLGGTKKIALDFLERKAEFSAGPVSLAFKTGAAVLPLFTVRYRYKTRVIIEPEMALIGEEADDGIATNSQRYVNILEDYVKKYPCHYIRLFGYKRPFFVD